MDGFSFLTALFVSTSTQFNLPPGLLESLCYVESKHQVTAVHEDDGGSDSIGICQIKWSTAKDLGFTGDPVDLMAPKINIYYAAKFLSRQRSRYNGDLTKAVIAYNLGHAGTLKRTKYSDKVFKQWRQNERR